VLNCRGPELAAEVAVEAAQEVWGAGEVATSDTLKANRNLML
jgi:hypothetical protein